MALFLTYLALCAAILVLGAKVRRLEERDENKTIILGNMLAGRLDGVERNEDGEIVAKEGEKYFGNKATDGEEGTEADRLFRHIVRSGHRSTLEHLSYTFAIEGVSRALLAQLTRHRVGFSYSVQSQRYVKFGSGDKSGGFDYIVPDSVKGKEVPDYQYGAEMDEDYEVIEWVNYTAEQVYDEFMRDAQLAYDRLRRAGVSAEDARAVLPQAAACNLTMTANLRSLLDFYGKRKAGRGAQGEISELAERLKDAVIAVDPWAEAYFKEA